MTTTQQRKKPPEPPSKPLPGTVACLEQQECLVNLVGDYSYLSGGYYTSQDRPGNGLALHPTNREALDAYVVPVFLEKARLVGMPVPDWYITNGYFEPPVIVDAINPFMTRHSVVLKTVAVEHVAKSMTRNSTYAVCCQELPPGSAIREFRSVLGWSAAPQYRDLAEGVWRVFRIPLATVRVILTREGQPLLSALGPLPLKCLTTRETAHLRSVVSWPT